MSWRHFPKAAVTNAFARIAIANWLVRSGSSFSFYTRTVVLHAFGLSTHQQVGCCASRERCANTGLVGRAVSMSSSVEFRSTSYDWEGQWSKGLGKGDRWDTGVVSPALQNLLDKGVLPKGRSLVPGCGRGYDAVAFGRSGYDSIGLDLSPSGVEEARAFLAEQKELVSGKVEFRSGDFFKFSPKKQGQFDVIVDYTFFCALDPTSRDAWADHMVSLLAPEGELVTLIFPIVEKEGGPPFAVSEDIVCGLLESRGLEARQLEKLPDSLCHAGREGKTALGRWRFRAN